MIINLSNLDRAGEALSIYFTRIDPVEMYLAMSIILALYEYLDSVTAGRDVEDHWLAEIHDNVALFYTIAGRKVGTDE